VHWHSITAYLLPGSDSHRAGYGNSWSSCAGIFGFLLLLAPCVRSVSAQVSAAHRGTVTNESGGAVATATVTVKNLDTGVTRTGTHRFNGGLSLRGVYTLSKAHDDGDSLNATTSGGEPGAGFGPLRAARRPGAGEL
jgi:hypothetical protein